jgi:hypothetical protein
MLTFPNFLSKGQSMVFWTSFYANRKKNGATAKSKDRVDDEVEM